MVEGNGKKKIISLSVNFILIMILLFPKEIYAPIALKEINASLGQIKLTFIREWGRERAKNKSEMFYEPQDIEIGKNGLIYILDSGNNRIHVFDNSGKYIRTIGKKGQGPGEFFFIRSTLQ